MTTLHKPAQQTLDWLYDNDVVHPTKVSEDLRAALAQQAPEPCEPLEVLKRALEIIAVGDSKNPQQDAADALVDIGFWSGEAPQPQPKSETCTWHQDGDSDSGVYATSCRRFFDLTDGTPEDNKMSWCCYCGKRLVQELIAEGGDD